MKFKEVMLEIAGKSLQWEYDVPRGIFHILREMGNSQRIIKSEHDFVEDFTDSGMRLGWTYFEMRDLVNSTINHMLNKEVNNRWKDIAELNRMDQIKDRQRRQSQPLNQAEQEKVNRDMDTSWRLRNKAWQLE